VKFHARVASVGESGKKIKIKREALYCTYIPGALLRPIGTNFELHVRLVDVINCTKHYRNRLKSLDCMSGQSLTIPIGLRYRR